MRNLTPLSIIICVFTAQACGDSPKSEIDAGPEVDVTVEHCDYQTVAATAGAGGTVVVAELVAGASEDILDIPVGTALGAFPSRAGFLGAASNVDLRRGAMSGSFNPSIGVQNAPKVKVLALRAGEGQAIIVKLDLGLMYEGLVFDVEAKLGAEFQGKVIISASHSHSSWGQQTGSFVFQVGLGDFRQLIYDRYIDTIARVVQEAISAQRPAKIGILADFNFDLEDLVSRDRRPENDDLMGGSRKDSSMFMIRVDGVDNEPIAALPIYGIHGTLMGENNSFASTDATGGAERWLEEQFESKVLVMHLQGAGGEVAPRGYGQLDCEANPGNEDDPCFEWLSLEGHGRAALPALLAAYQAAGNDMKTEIALEMMSRSVETGPFPETFSIRDGSLRYAPFEVAREADREIYDGTGAILSPLDEFNAPVGAALCEADIDDPSSAYPLFPAGLMPGTDALPPYGACVRIDAAADILSQLIKLEKGAVDASHPVCESTRTTISALRLGEFIVGTMPGELTIMLADKIRDISPVAADKTILLGYAQGHSGYLLTPEDWLQGGYETSINIWGPLEAEYVSEQLSDLLTLAATPQREDGSAGGTTRVATDVTVDTFPHDVVAAMAGTIPASVPERIWLRTGPAAQAQPLAQIQRVSGHASFVWIGDDPITKTPVVTLQREEDGVFTDVQRRSGRTVRTDEILLSYTPQPLRRDGDNPQTHYWVAEWQAVPWTGASDDAGNSLDGLDARAGVQLGRYRFHVIGENYEIDSDAFEVTQATIGVVANRVATTIEAQLSVHAPKGFRLLDLTSPSNQPVPLRAGLFSVSLTILNQSPMIIQNIEVDANGTLSIDAGKSALLVTDILVTDAFGNTGMATL